MSNLYEVQRTGQLSDAKTATWYVERERINARGELEYYDAWRTQEGWTVARDRFDATEPVHGERVYLGYSDATQATILRWRGDLTP